MLISVLCNLKRKLIKELKNKNKNILKKEEIGGINLPMNKVILLTHTL